MIDSHLTILTCTPLKTPQKQRLFGYFSRSSPAIAGGDMASAGP